MAVEADIAGVVVEVVRVDVVDVVVGDVVVEDAVVVEYAVVVVGDGAVVVNVWCCCRCCAV